MERRYDIDRIRVVAIGLLIIYHAAIGFQPWGGLIGFIQNHTIIDWIWYPMSMLNMWRIPILFFISGMGVYFAMQKRNMLQLFLERSRRILLPFLFGIIAIVPIHVLIWQIYYHQDIAYKISMAHLWFLQNIFVYVITLVPFFYLLQKKDKNNRIQKLILLVKHPFLLIISTALYIVGTSIFKPELYTLYAFTAHGWYIGFISFLIGFIMMSLGKNFWEGFKKWKWFYLILASALFALRITFYESNSPLPLMCLESLSWIFTVFGVFYQYLNKPFNRLTYLNTAVYPVYILHMIFQYTASYFIFPLEMNSNIKLPIIIIFTLGASLASYEFIIKRCKVLRILFGLRMEK